MAVLHVPDELELIQRDVEVGVFELGGLFVLLKLIQPVLLQHTVTNCGRDSLTRFLLKVLFHSKYLVLLVSFNQYRYRYKYPKGRCMFLQQKFLVKVGTYRTVPHLPRYLPIYPERYLHFCANS